MIACAARSAGATEHAIAVRVAGVGVVASVTRPVQQLVGFVRLDLPVGAARRLTFRLDASQLAFFDAGMRFVVEPGEFEVMLGASSADIRLRGGFVIAGEVRELCTADLRPTAVRSEAC